MIIISKSFSLISLIPDSFCNSSYTIKFALIIVIDKVKEKVKDVKDAVVDTTKDVADKTKDKIN
ncbi:hypothetical protein [Candidatus Nitrosocosmicus sp. R]